MTPDQHAEILRKLAYYFGELCKENNKPTTNEYNWIMAGRMFDIEMEINGDEWLLSLLKENKDE